MNFLLFAIAYVLLLPLTIANYIVVVRSRNVSSKGYFRSTAVNIDRFANREFRSMWNRYLIIEGGYHFGNPEETISSALGKNKRNGTLSKWGEILDKILNLFEKDHSIKSIQE